MLLLFDLDGTLLDSSEGIYNSVRYAEKKMGLIPVSNDILREFVGPPPKEMYSKVYDLDEESAQRATMFHREYSEKKGIYESVPYPNIQLVLQELKRKGYILGVATLKKQSLADEVLKYTKMNYFDVIVGMDPEEKSSKVDIIRTAMECVNCSEAIMIGDTEYDYRGALAAGIGFIGVLYGFGFDRNGVYPFPTAERAIDLLDVM